MGSSCVGYEWYWSGCSGAVEVGLLHKGGKAGSGGWSQHRRCHPWPDAVTSGPGAVTTPVGHRVLLDKARSRSYLGSLLRSSRTWSQRQDWRQGCLHQGGRWGRLVRPINSGLWLSQSPGPALYKLTHFPEGLTLLCRRALHWVLSYKSSCDLHTCSAPVTSSPVIFAWNLKSPEPASSKVIWILSTGFSFVGASQLLGGLFLVSQHCWGVCCFFHPQERPQTSGEIQVRWQPGKFACKWLEGLQLLEIKTSPWRDGNNSICKCNWVY